MVDMFFSLHVLGESPADYIQGEYFYTSHPESMQFSIN